MGISGSRAVLLVCLSPPATVFNWRLSRKLNSVGTLGVIRLGSPSGVSLCRRQDEAGSLSSPPVFQVSAYPAPVVLLMSRGQGSHAAKPKVNGGGSGFHKGMNARRQGSWGPLT